MHAFVPLTPKQYEVLLKLGEGKSICEIAYEMEIATQTVKNHISDMQSRLGVKNKTSLAVYAITGYLPPDASTRRRAMAAASGEEDKDYEDIDFTNRSLGGLDNDY